MIVTPSPRISPLIARSSWRGTGPSFVVADQAGDRRRRRPHDRHARAGRVDRGAPSPTPVRVVATRSFELAFVSARASERSCLSRGLVELYAHVSRHRRCTGDFGPGSMSSPVRRGGQDAAAGALELCLAATGPLSRHAMPAEMRTAALFVRDGREVVLNPESTRDGDAFAAPSTAWSPAPRRCGRWPPNSSDSRTAHRWRFRNRAECFG